MSPPPLLLPWVVRRRCAARWEDGRLRFWPAAVVAVAAAVTGAVLTGVATMAPPRSRRLVVAARGSALARSRVVSIGSGCRACRSIGL